MILKSCTNGFGSGFRFINNIEDASTRNFPSAIFAERCFKGRQGSCLSVGVPIFPAGKDVLRRKPKLHIYIRNSKWKEGRGHDIKIFVSER